jgi:selenocysteine lyase/cysteine desulfurase
VTFTFGRGPVADKALVSFLESRRIYVSARYCSGVGGVRIAVHFFNSREDVEALLAAVDEFRNRS